jgi:hypothetical protein
MSGPVLTCDSFPSYVLRPGLHETLTTPEITEQIHEIFVEDRRFSDKSIHEQQGIPHERDESTIHEDMDMPTVSETWAPKSLIAYRNLQRCQSSEQNLKICAIQMIS